MSEKWGPFKPESRKIGSFIYFLLKNGGQSYTWQRWKRGPFGTHIRTMPYIESYHPPTPPPPEHHYNSTNKHSILAISLNFALMLNRVPKIQNWVFFYSIIKTHLNFINKEFFFFFFFFLVFFCFFFFCFLDSQERMKGFFIRRTQTDQTTRMRRLI